MENWHEEIFSYFDLMPNPVTNAYTECLNGIIKNINRDGRGYKFDVLRAKILFSEGTHKVVTPKFNRRTSGIASMMDLLISEAGEDYHIRDHGVDMYTLLHLLEDGLIFSINNNSRIASKTLFRLLNLIQIQDGFYILIWLGWKGLDQKGADPRYVQRALLVPKPHLYRSVHHAHRSDRTSSG